MPGCFLPGRVLRTAAAQPEAGRSSKICGHSHPNRGDFWARPELCLRRAFACAVIRQRFLSRHSEVTLDLEMCPAHWLEWTGVTARQGRVLKEPELA